MACDTTNTWETEVIPMIRVLISDNISPYVYSEEQLREISLSAARIVLNEMSFNHTYTIDIESSSITPDPKPLKDESFMNFMALKSACVIIGGEARIASKNAVKWTDGPSSLDTQFAAKELSLLSQKMTNDYEKAKMDWALGPNGVAGQAIFTPYTSSNVSDYYHPMRYDGF